MPILKLTKTGLFAIAGAVALLWICLFSERMMLSRAYAERAAVMRSVARMQGKSHSRPVSAPKPPRTESNRPSFT